MGVEFFGGVLELRVIVVFSGFGGNVSYRENVGERTMIGDGFVEGVEMYLVFILRGGICWEGISEKIVFLLVCKEIWVVIVNKW